MSNDRLLASNVVVAARVGARVVVCVVVCVGVVGALAGCPPAPACGDGVADDGEDETTCCQDTGCTFGVCGNGGGACVFPWSSTCTAGECDGPYRCNGGGAPPSYSCGECGCVGADACVGASGAGGDGPGGVCFDSTTRGFARDNDVLPDDLDETEYARIYTELGALPKIPLEAVADRIAEAMRADPRTNTIVYGADDGADVAVVDDAIESQLGFAPSPRNALTGAAADCDAIDVAASTSLLPALTVAQVPKDAATKQTCSYPGTFASCVLPQAAECVLGAGRFAATIVVLDQVVTLPQMDEAMLVRASIATPETVSAILDQGVVAFGDAAAVVRADEGLVVGSRIAAGFATSDPLVFFVILADANAKPLRLGSFRAVWDDATLQAFLIGHDIQPRDCEFVVNDGGNVEMHCENGAASLDATVDGGNFSIIDVTTSP